MQINSVTPPITPFRSSVQALESTPQASKETDNISSDIKKVILPESSGTWHNSNGTASDSPVAESASLPYTSSLKSSSGYAGIPIKLATVVYALNHSFDPQKQMIDVLI